MAQNEPDWPELFEDIQLELKLLHELLEKTADLRAALGGRAPSLTEKLAAATLLQSFYNGIEKVFDILAERIDLDRPAGEDRHHRLLEQMAQPRPDRAAVVSAALRDGLAEYLEFRNSYRYGYYFRLDWPQAAGLVGQVADTLGRLEAELDAFFRDHAGRRLIGRPVPEGLPDYWFAPPRRPTGAEARPAARRWLLAGLVGLAVGLGIGRLTEYLRSRPKTAPVDPAEIRALVGPLAGRLKPYESDPNVRHAAGVLGFFDRADWTFTAPGRRWNRSGDLPGRCESLGASAVLGFLEGRLVRIDITTARDAYEYTIAAGALRRAARRALPTGRRIYEVDFDPDGAPARIFHTAETPAGRVATETFYHAGLAVLTVLADPNGRIRRVRFPDGEDRAGILDPPGGTSRPAAQPARSAREGRQRSSDADLPPSTPSPPGRSIR